jgi:hypothetical protein
MEDLLISIKLHLVLVSTVLETLTARKAWFDLQIKRKCSADCGFICINFSLKISTLAVVYIYQYKQISDSHLRKNISVITLL